MIEAADDALDNPDNHPAGFDEKEKKKKNGSGAPPGSFKSSIDAVYLGRTNSELSGVLDEIVVEEDNADFFTTDPTKVSVRKSEARDERGAECESKRRITEALTVTRKVKPERRSTAPPA